MLKDLKPFLASLVVLCFTLLFVGILITSCAPVQGISGLGGQGRIERSPEAYVAIPEIRNAHEAVVSIMRNSDEKGLQVIGAGVTVHCKKNQPRVVVTAWHVAKGFVEPEEGEEKVTGIITVGSKRKHEVRLMRFAGKMEQKDLAILVGAGAESEDCASVALAEETPQLGSTVWVIGAANRREGNITKGVLSHVYNIEGTLLYRTDAEVFFGNSGGGMFNEKGELVGVVVSMEAFIIPPTIILVPGGGTAVSVVHVADLLKSIF